MDAIVLVGGEGTRLRPLTYDTPKQMLPVVDRPMIEHVVGHLAALGVTRAILSLGYRPDAFLEAFPGRRIAGAELVFAVEPELLDTAGAVRYAARSAGVDSTFLVVNGDVLSDFDFRELVTVHRERRAVATIHLTPVEDPSVFGVVPTDADGRVTAFIEKPPRELAPTNLINAGCYILEPSVLERIPAGRRVSIERETFPELAGEGSLYAMASLAYWLDTGTPAKYLQASLDILRGRRASTCLPRVPEIAPSVFVDPAAAVEGELQRACFVGRGARIARGAAASESVVLEGASVHGGARLTRSMVMAGAVIDAGSEIEDSIVGPDAHVGPACKITGYSLIGGRCEVPASSALQGDRFGLR